MFRIEDPEKRSSCNQILIILLITVIVGIVIVTLIITLPSGSIQNATNDKVHNVQLNATIQSSNYKTLTINKLPSYIDFNQFLTATSTGLLPLSDKLKVNDRVFITGEGSYNGIYKVVNLGSMTDKWILEKIK